MKARSRSIVEAAELILHSLPELQEHISDPSLNGWVQEIHELARESSVAPLAHIWSELLSQLGNFDTYLEIIKAAARQSSSSTWSKLVKLSSRPEVSDFVSCVVSTTGLLGWAAAAGVELLRDHGVNRTRYPGWDDLPFICATSAMTAGALEGAAALLDYTNEVWMASKHFSSREIDVLGRCRTIGAQVANKITNLVSNLATDLHNSCLGIGDYFRAEVGALLWSAGMVPESQALRRVAQSSWVPSERLLRVIVAQSVTGYPVDVLKQHIWLRMKDRGPFDLRKHKELFVKLNRRYYFGSAAALDVLGANYARALISWFKDELAEEQMAELVRGASYLANVTHGAASEVEVTSRYNALTFALLYVKQGEARERDFAKHFESIVNDVDDWRYADTFRVDRTAPTAQVNVPMFYFNAFATRSLSHGQSGTAREKRIVDKMEESRTAGLAYWLSAIPVPANASERAILGPLLRQEAVGLQELRGAYFRRLLPHLPQHFYRVSYNPDEADGTRSIYSEEDQQFGWGAVSDRLRSSYQAMLPLAPRYASLHLRPQATLESIIAALGSHRDAR